MNLTNSITATALGMPILPGKSSLKEGWDGLWGGIEGEIGGVLTILAIIGAAMVIGAIIAWLFERRRGGGGMFSGQKSTALIWTIVIGMILAGPEILGFLLAIIDWIINGISAVIQNSSR